jgi:hypothetical protein
MDMGDPTEPGEDQLATVVIEGPPANADAATIADYNRKFEEFKQKVRALRTQYPNLKIKLAKVEYVKKK